MCMRGYHPYGPEEGFNEAGWHFRAWQPSGPGVEQVIIIRATKKGCKKHEVRVPLTHAPRFGIDVDDHASAEKAVERLIKELIR
jgi:hypothetical protein